MTDRTEPLRATLRTPRLSRLLVSKRGKTITVDAHFRIGKVRTALLHIDGTYDYLQIGHRQEELEPEPDWVPWLKQHCVFDRDVFEKDIAQLDLPGDSHRIGGPLRRSLELAVREIVDELKAEQAATTGGAA